MHNMSGSSGEDPDAGQKKALSESLKGDDIEKAMAKAGVNRSQAVNALLGSSVARKPLSQQRQALFEVLEDGNVEMVMAAASVNGEQAIRVLLDSSRNLADALTSLDPAWRQRRELREVLEDEAIDKALGKANVSREQAVQALLDSSIAGESLARQRDALRVVLEDNNIDITMGPGADGHWTSQCSWSLEQTLTALLNSDGDIVDALKLLDPAFRVLEHVPNGTPAVEKSWPAPRAPAQPEELAPKGNCIVNSSPAPQEEPEEGLACDKAKAAGSRNSKNRRRVKAAGSDVRKLEAVRLPFNSFGHYA